MRRVVAYLVVAVLVALSVHLIQSCNGNPGETQSASAPNPTTPVPSSPADITLPNETIGLSDGYLAMEQAIQVTGTDRRPFWTVQGRVTNISWKYEVHRVKIHVVLTDSAGALAIDAADLDLKLDIPPIEVKGFAEQSACCLRSKAIGNGSGKSLLSRADL